MGSPGVQKIPKQNPFRNVLLNTYYVPGTIIGAWARSVDKKTKFLALVECTFQQNQVKRRLGFFVCFEIVLVSRKGMGPGVRQAWVKRPPLIIQMTSGEAT